MDKRSAPRNVIYVAVVDNDESACRSFSRLLRAAGFQPVTYVSAEALLEDAKRPRFDCLLLDIQLEGMSGLELSRRLKAIRDQTPVIFVTAHDDPDIKQEALVSGCVGFFSKTAPAELVLEAIRRAVGISHREGSDSVNGPTNIGN
jgi:FixJ family two-component response regulator